MPTPRESGGTTAPQIKILPGADQVTTPTESVTQDPNKGFTVLNMGDIGTGKTTALRTLINSGVKPCVLATEPGIDAILGDLPKGSYHLVYIAPADVGWADMISIAKMINASTLQGIAEQGSIKKNLYQQYIEVLMACSNFVCQKTGEVLGPVDSWNTDRAFCLDTLSGFNKMCMNFIVGGKPVASQLDWQAAQKMNMVVIDRLVTGCKCHVIVNAHVEREPDEVLGGTKVMASSLGKKLAPLLPRDFDNVILSEVDSGGKHTWSTIPGKAMLKSRHLPRSDKLTPDYKQLVEAWKAKGGIILPSKPQV